MAQPKLLLSSRQLVSTFAVVAIAIVAIGGYMHTSKSRASTAVPSDINNDGKVNVLDLSILLSHWTGDQLAVTPVSTPVATATSTPAPPVSGGSTLSVEVTYYGSYDNDPKGSLAISNPVIHQTAGGTGTYADPLTFASPSGAGAYAVGEIIYVPDVQKYFIKEDECAVSWTAPSGCGATSHVDLYVGNPSSDISVLKCEESLTRTGNATVIVNPPDNLTVDPQKIWDQSTGACMQLH
ncbi:MAG: hypothetical protein NVSMB39_0700 [Candidatus Saccharimonadales bacterium]